MTILIIWIKYLVLTQELLKQIFKCKISAGMLWFVNDFGDKLYVFFRIFIRLFVSQFLIFAIWVENYWEKKRKDIRDKGIFLPTRVATARHF